MKERIRKIMESEDMTPARFADNLNIGRAVISHILNGRNNPSLEVITRILSNMPQINSDWLLTGNGSMYKGTNNTGSSHSFDNDDTAIITKNPFPDLFAPMPTENPINTSNHTERGEYVRQEGVNSSPDDVQAIVNEKIIYKELPPKKIRQIIIYYTDNTFETFTSD